MKIRLLKHFDRTAFAGDGFDYSYADALSRSDAAFEKFAKYSPERVAIFAENSPEWVFALYGAWKAGAAAIPIDAKSSAEEAAFILSDAAPQILCCDRSTLETARKAAEGLAVEFFVLEDMFEGIPAAGGSAGGEIWREGEDLAFIVYTSGTTGAPKGVMLTFANMYANMKAVEEAKYYFDGIRVLIMLPFHHILPLMGTLVMPLYVGGQMVFPKSISPADISGILQKRPVDMVISVPRFYELLHTNIMAKINRSALLKAIFALARALGSRKFSLALFSSIHKRFGGEIKFWISGGAALDRNVWADLDALGFALREGYGMTECAPIIAFPRIGRIKIGSPGEPLPGVQIRIADGEIAVRGENVTRGYYNRPDETKAAIRNGWLFTGDLGYVDDEGFLFITGRRKEIIVLPNGKNINPAEMEAQIAAQSPEILEVGVLMHENILQAIVRVKPEFVAASGGAEAAEAAIRDTAILPYNRATATYRRIIRIALTTDELPRTRVGKLKRHHLSAYLENISRRKPETPLPEPESQTYSELKDVLSGQIALPVSPDAHMEMDLGLDSLGKISIQCYVRENCGAEVSERDFEKYPTLRKFSEFVEKNRNSSFEPQTKNVTWSNIINALPLPKLKKPHFFHFATISAFRAILKLAYRLRYRGLENLESSEPLIIAPNHQSYLDGAFAVGPFSKTQIYKTYFFAKLRSIIKKGFIRKFAERSNVVIMDINDNVSESIRKLAQALREGDRVVIFPEGTRTKDGRISEFRHTFAILAKEMGVKVVPVAIRGAYEALKPGATFPKPGAEICVSYLPPMSAGENESYEDFSRRVRGRVEEEWEAMGAAHRR